MLEYIFPPFETCAVCNNVDQKSLELGICESCYKKFKFLDRMDCCIEYDDASKYLVQDLKYNNKRYIAKIFAALSKEKIDKFDYDLITFVPRYKKKPLEKKVQTKKRSYNQGKLIAKSLDKNALPLLIKIKDTKSQTDLKGEERIRNLKGAFSIIDKDIIKDKKILIVDDVITTGTTLNECKFTLMKGGAKIVYIFGIFG